MAADRSSTSTPAGARIAMLVHSYYEEDPRVRREAEALAAAGHRVDVFALRRPGDPGTVTIDGVVVHRLPVHRHQGARLRVYLREYLSFFVRSMVALTRSHIRRRYALVQVHTLPDFLVFATLPLRLVGVPVILDLHEAMPEFFSARFGSRPSGVGVRVLRLQERIACRFATAVVTVNRALGDRLVGLGVDPAKLTIVPNAPSLVRFSPTAHPSRAFMEDGTLRLVYTGALSPTYELDVAFQAVAQLVREDPDLDVRLELYGRDFAEVPLPALADRLGVTDRVTFHDRIAIDAVPAALAGTDIGLAPTRHTPFTDYSLSTKVYEYAAMGRPVVASRLPMVVATFGDDVVTYEPGDAGDLARAIKDVVGNADERRARIERARARVQGLSWEVESLRYLAIVDGLVSRAQPQPVTSREA